MKALASKQFWLWPVAARRFIYLAAWGDKWLEMPFVGFCRKYDRSHFVIVIGKLHLGMTIA